MDSFPGQTDRQSVNQSPDNSGRACMGADDGQQRSETLIRMLRVMPWYAGWDPAATKTCTMHVNIRRREGEGTRGCGAS